MEIFMCVYIHMYVTGKVIQFMAGYQVEASNFYNFMIKR